MDELRSVVRFPVEGEIALCTFRARPVSGHPFPIQWDTENPVPGGTTTSPALPSVEHILNIKCRDHLALRTAITKYATLRRHLNQHGWTLLGHSATGSEVVCNFRLQVHAVHNRDANKMCSKFGSENSSERKRRFENWGADQWTVQLVTRSHISVC